MRISDCRVPHAASRMQALLLERYAMPFAWGFRDCALFAADCVEAVTGRDPAADFRGAYLSALGALRIIRAHGGLAELAAARVGPAIEASSAIDGDVCLLLPHAHETPLPGLGALGVLWRGAIIAQGDSGLGVHRLAAADRWWRAKP
jgi:hypothetical protein